MPYRIADLFATPQHIPLVAGWIYEEFWSDKDELSAEALAGLFARATRSDAIPLALLALEGDEPVGTASLVACDDPQRKHLRPWLAALYVRPEARGRGIGSALVRIVRERAARLGYQALYLGTDNPGFYRRLGAVVHEQVNETFCVMSISAG